MKAAKIENSNTHTLYLSVKDIILKIINNI